MQAFSHLALPGIILVSALGALIMCVLVLAYGFPSLRDEKADKGLLVTRLGHAAAGVLFTMVILFTVVHLDRQARDAPGMMTTAVTNEPAEALTPRIAALEERLAAGESRAGALDQRLAAGESQARDLTQRLAAGESQASTLKDRLAAGESRTSALDERLKAVDARSRAAAAQASALETELRRAGRAAPRGATLAPDAGSAQPSALPSESQGTGPAGEVRTTPVPTRPPSRPVAPVQPLQATIKPPTATASPAQPGAAAANPPAETSGAQPVAAAAKPPVERDLGTKVREDWTTIKRDVKAATEDVRDGIRRFMEWIKP